MARLTLPPATETTGAGIFGFINDFINRPNSIYIIAAAAVGLVLLVILAMLLIKRRGGKMPEANPGGIQIYNIQGIGAREEQQDSFAVSDAGDTRRGVFAVVADGMGGTADGAAISKIVVSDMIRVFKSSHGGQEPSELLLRMAYEAQNNARAFIRKNGNRVSGSTLVAVLLNNNRLHFISVGDSRVYLLRSGALVKLNREHTLASELDEQAARGLISIEEARSDPQRNALTSYIGLDGQLITDGNTEAITLRDGDRVLLMSDGVFGTLSEAEMARCAGMENIYEAGAAMEAAVKDKRKQHQDNFTAVFIAVNTGGSDESKA